MLTVNWHVRTRKWEVSSIDRNGGNRNIQNSLHFADDLHEAKGAINDLTRRMHELELELRRLENERDELTAAYKEAEAVSINGEIMSI